MTVRNTSHKTLGICRLLALALISIIVATITVKDTYGQSFDSSVVVSGGAKKTGGLFGPLDPFGLVMGINYRAPGTFDATTPQAYIPPVFGTSIPVASGNSAFHFKQSDQVNLRVGLRFYSILEGGIIGRNSKFETTLPADNPYSGEYQTYWGGYQYGNYAAIGEMDVKDQDMGWYAQVQTPDINISKHFALQPFVSVSMIESAVSFKSGYHRYAQSFNPGYASAKLGKIKDIPARAGLLIKYKINENWSVGLEGYAERNLGGFSATSQGDQFNVQSDNDSNKIEPGGGIQIQCRF